MEDYLFLGVLVVVILIKVLNHYKIINYKTSDLIEDLKETSDDISDVKEEVDEIKEKVEDVILKGGKK